MPPTRIEAQPGVPISIGSATAQITCEVQFDANPQGAVTLNITEIPGGVIARHCVDETPQAPVDAGTSMALPACLSLSIDGGFGEGYEIGAQSRWGQRALVAE